MTVVTYEDSPANEPKQVVTNPEVVAELVYFLTLLVLGFTLLYGVHDEGPQLIDYGIIFLSSGFIPSVTLIAEIIRQREVVREHGLWEVVVIQEAVVKVLLTLAGTIMIIAAAKDDRDCDASETDTTSSSSWGIYVGTNTT